MFSGDATKPTMKARDHAFFNIYDGVCENILLNDVIDFVYMYDRMPDNMLYGKDINICMHYVVGEGICGVVPDNLLAQSRLISKSLSKLKDNTTTFFSNFFEDISARILKTKSSLAPEPPKPSLTPFKFMSEATELPVYDRLGIINFYEQNDPIVVKDGDFYLLVKLSKNEYVKVHRTLKKYNSIKTIFDECTWEKSA
jgi:hypothetical protein